MYKSTIKLLEIQSELTRIFIFVQHFIVIKEEIITNINMQNIQHVRFISDEEHKGTRKGDRGGLRTLVVLSHRMEKSLTE